MFTSFLLIIAIFTFIGLLPAIASQEEPEPSDPTPFEEIVGNITEGIQRGFGLAQDLIQGEDQGFETSAAEEIRFQKQCFLSYNMLELHEKVRDIQGREPGQPVTDPTYHTVLYGAPAADITSLIVSRPQIQPLMQVRPQLLSYLVPYIKLYKVYGAPRSGLELPEAPPDNTEIEFIFETHLDRRDIDEITSTRSARPGGVGLESFSWEFLGVNPAEVENNIRATLNVHFNNMKDFERIRQSLGTDYTYRFSDLVIPEPLYHATTSEEIERERGEFNPKFFRLKMVAGWAMPPSQGAERETFEQLLDGISYDEFRELVRLNKKVMYLNLISHSLSFNQDGSMSLSAEYQAVVEGTFTSTNSDILRVQPGPGTTGAAAVVDQIGQDIRAIHNVRGCVDRAGRLGDGGSVVIPEGGRDPIYYSPGEDGDNEEELDDLRDLLEDMSRHQREAEQVLALYQRCDRAQAYSNLMRELMSRDKVYRVTVTPESLGFDTFPYGEGIERGNVTSSVRRTAQTAYASLGGSGVIERATPGLGERVEAFNPSLSWLQGLLGVGEGTDSSRQQENRAREEMEIDPTLLRRMMAINRFYEGANFTVERLGAYNFSGEATCGDILGVIGAMGQMNNISLSSLGTSEFETQMTENEEQLNAAIARMRQYVLFGAQDDVVVEPGGLLNNPRIRSGGVPIDFMFFGDILDAFAKSSSSWLDENRVEMYLGTFTFNDPREYVSGQQGTSSGRPIPLAWIPISVELFSMWFLEEIVEKQTEQMTLRTFIRSVFDKLIINAFGSECVLDPTGGFALTQETLSGVPEFYTIPQYKILENNLGPRGSVLYSHMFDALRGENPVYLLDYHNDTFDSYVNLVIYQGHNEDDTLNFIHQRDMNREPYIDIAERDVEEGIYHLNLGSDRGLVKTINFSRMDQPYERAFRMESAGDMGGLATIRERYNASISMFGNMFFYPGQHVYINPSMVGAGTVPELSALTTKLGLGGYFVILRVENIIERGLFETNLQCSWVHSGFVTDAAQQEDGQCKANALLSRSYQTAEPVDRVDDLLSDIRQEAAELIDAAGEALTETYNRARTMLGDIF